MTARENFHFGSFPVQSNKTPIYLVLATRFTSPRVTSLFHRYWAYLHTGSCLFLSISHLSDVILICKFYLLGVLGCRTSNIQRVSNRNRSTGAFNTRVYEHSQCSTLIATWTPTKLPDASSSASPQHRTSGASAEMRLPFPITEHVSPLSFTAQRFHRQEQDVYFQICKRFQKTERNSAQSKVQQSRNINKTDRLGAH